MKSFIMQIILYLCLSAFPCLAQHVSSQDSLLNHLTGKWTLQGTIAGNQTTHDILGERVVGNQYLLLTEVSREKDSGGNPSYEAKVFITWNHTSNQYDCLWLDNTGNEGLKDGVVGHSKQRADRLEFIFKVSDSTNFYTTFIYNKDTDTWQWIMDGEENNKTQPFASVTLTRNKMPSTKILK